MNNKLSKVLSCFALALCTPVFASVAVNASPAASYQNGAYQPAEYHVADVNAFVAAISNACHGTTITLDGDILLDRNVEICSSILLDLNGYSINMSNGAELVIGGKVFSHVEYYTVKHPGYYTTDKEVTYVPQPDEPVYDEWGNFLYNQHVPDKEVVTYKDVWHDGWTETKSRDVYDYLDSLDILITDGWINGASGRNGADGVENTFRDCDGKNGGDGSAAIRLISGTLRLSKTYITGGNGGNGGDGKYQAILHIPFFTGNGGDGGNGGKAGSAVIIEREAAHLVQGKSVNLNCGTPGHGGKGGPANTNHWVGKGKDGKNGREGKSAYAIVQ
ncbi:MAG: hypothetical protein IKE05_01180 [Clostridia bacterium]|nr:hypothetical protein [Clostridia bacterium]